MKKSSLFVLVLVFAAMCAATFIVDQVTEHFPRIDDELTYVYQARIYQTGHLYIDAPSPRHAYYQSFLLDCFDRIESNYDVDCYGRRFGKYPPGWPLALTLGTAIRYPWAVNLWFAGLNVALMYHIGRRIYDRTVGMVAAFLYTVSPLAILLSGTLMSHTFTHFLVLIFLLGLWNIQQHYHPYRWAVAAGIALGWLAMSRPLSGVGVAIPWVLYSFARLLWTFFRDRYGIVTRAGEETKAIVPQHLQPRFLQALIPLVILGFFAVLIGSFYLVNNYVLTGHPTANLYELVNGWEHDKIGFGKDKGFGGHSPEQAWEKIKGSAKCYNRDLFGWVLQPDNPPDRLIPLRNMCVNHRAGISWILLPLGLIFMPRRRLWSVMLVLMAASVIFTSGLYWGVGPGYGTRYWFEFTGGLILISAVGVVGLSRWAAQHHRLLKPAVYLLLIAATIFVMVDFMPARLDPINRYPCKKFNYIDTVNELRQSPDLPVVVIVYGEQAECRGYTVWWDYGELLVWTGPQEEHDVIAVRDINKDYIYLLIERYQDKREIMVMMYNRIYRLEDVIDFIDQDQTALNGASS